MSKTKITEDERNELTKKMDEDIDKFMETLAANQKTKKKKEFNLEEFFKEIDNHPAFMKNAKGNEFSEHLEALQSMKYDNEDEDIVDTANNHKENGNKHFKFKKYRWAIAEYTEAIKLKIPDCKFNSILYNNRATCHKYLGNYRAAFKDCRIALKFDPTHTKAIIRISEIIDKFKPEADILTNLSKTIVEAVKNNPELSENDSEGVLSKAISKMIKKSVELTKAEKIRKERIQIEKYADDSKKEILLKKLKETNIKFYPKFDFNDYKLFDWDDLIVNLPGMTELQCVYYDKEDKCLNWPLLLQYPEVGKMDSLINCPDNCLLEDILYAPFEHPQPWDPNYYFNLKNIRLFLEIDSIDDEYVIEIFLNQTLKDALSTNNYVVKRGLPVFLVYTKDHIQDLIEPVNGRMNWYKLK